MLIEMTVNFINMIDLHTYTIKSVLVIISIHWDLLALVLSLGSLYEDGLCNVCICLKLVLAKISVCHL